MAEPHAVARVPYLSALGNAVREGYPSYAKMVALRKEAATFACIHGRFLGTAWRPRPSCARRTGRDSTAHTPTLEAPWKNVPCG